MKKAALVALTCVAVAGISQTASAYTRIKCSNGTALKWGSNSITMRLASNSFPAGAWRTAMTDSLQAWNRNPSKFRFSYVTGDTSVGKNNGQNEAWFTASDIGAPAVTYWWGNCSTGRFTENDVLFMNTVNYTTSNNVASLISYNGSFRPFRTTALHELGHVVGLGHTSNTYSIMGQDWDHIQANGSTVRTYPGEDAGRGAKAIYGNNTGNIQDVGSTHFRRTGSSGGYSTHAPVRIFNTSGSVLGSFRDSNGVLGYRVNRGQAVDVEFGFENNGEHTQSGIDASYYISTNNYISTSDTRIATYVNWTLAPDTVTYPRRRVTIPSNLTRGSVYYLGVFMDVNSEVSEVDEVNNRTYIPIRIN